MKILVNLVFLLCAVSAVRCQETQSQRAILGELNKSTYGIELYYPNSVKRFYKANGFNYAWIKTKAAAANTWAGMLLLDCVLQFGLNHTDYHPEKLAYDSLRTMINEPEKVPEVSKVKYDILLTDALITLINHLHHGKLNPEFTSGKIDRGGVRGFNAESELMRALSGKDFMMGILNVQPKVKAYEELQSYMRLIKGQYVDDCYEVPEAEARKVAINMERIRWADFSSGSYIHINVPSYSLALHEKNTTYDFKVIVGKPGTITPVLNSKVTHLTTGPDVKVPQSVFVKVLLPQAIKNTDFFEDHHYTIYDKNGKYVHINSISIKQIKNNPLAYTARKSAACDNFLSSVAFRFANKFDIYLHDSPNQELFERSIRALSHGCIRVQRAKDLAALLLRFDGSESKIPLMQKALNTYQKQNFILKNPVPIKITYLTCVIQDGLPLFYKDIYHLDDALEKKLYGVKTMDSPGNL